MKISLEGCHRHPNGMIEQPVLIENIGVTRPVSMPEEIMLTVSGPRGKVELLLTDADDRFIGQSLLRVAVD